MKCRQRHEKPPRRRCSPIPKLISKTSGRTLTLSAIAEECKLKTILYLVGLSRVLAKADIGNRQRSYLLTGKSFIVEGVFATDTSRGGNSLHERS